MIRLRDRFGYDNDPMPTRIYITWFDGPILVIWIWKFYIDLSYTKLASRALRGWFDGN